MQKFYTHQFNSRTKNNENDQFVANSLLKTCNFWKTFSLVLIFDAVLAGKKTESSRAKKSAKKGKLAIF